MTDAVKKLREIETGEQIVYHSGYNLDRDCQGNAVLKKVRQAAWLMHEAGQVSLVQRRYPGTKNVDSHFDYIAIGT